MSAPERIGVKKTTGYASNWWGVLTDAFDEHAVEYVRADRLTEALEALRDLADAARSACDARLHHPLIEALAEADAALAKLEDTK